VNQGYYAEVYRRSDGLWDWRVQAANNQVVATSGGQGFTERNDAEEAVWRLFGDVEIREA
jgi:uncharacterized protein YegP (UPF0339 family)